MADLRGPRFKYIAVGVVVVFITGSVVAAAAIPSVRQMVTRWLGGAVADADRHKKSKADQPVELIRDARGNAGVRLKEEACSGLGISPVEVKLADGPCPCPRRSARSITIMSDFSRSARVFRARSPRYARCPTSKAASGTRSGVF